MNVERAHYVEESPADVKAAEKLAKLHDELRVYNESNSETDLHDLNIYRTNENIYDLCVKDIEENL